MKLLVVSSYPDSASFGGLLKTRLLADLHAHGHSAAVSDLYEQKFPAIAFPEDFPSRSNPDFFDYQAEQLHAFKTRTSAAAVQAEQQKVRAADLILFLCPVYWASPPAILRGWLEQVLTPGFAYDKDRTFETGLLRGKSAFFVVTHAGKLGAATADGAGAKAQAFLAPLEDRPLHYSGLATLPALAIQPPAYPDTAARNAALDKAAAAITARVTAIGQGRALTAAPSSRHPVILINGRPGVGKKTVAEILARRTGGALIDNHLLLNPGVAACGRGTDGYYRVNRAVRQAVFGELVHETARRPVILTGALTDQVAEHREIHEEIRLLARKAPAPLTEIVLTAAFAENARRLASPARRQDFKLTDANELARLYNHYTIITPPDAVLIDTTSLPPEDSARLIQARLNRNPEIKP